MSNTHVRFLSWVLDEKIKNTYLINIFANVVSHRVGILDRDPVSVAHLAAKL